MIAALPHEITSMDQYQPYYHTINYLNQKRQSCSREEDELRKAAGYATVERFARHREEWHRCRGLIPMGYLESLDVDLRILSFTIELDKELYDRIEQLTLYVNDYGNIVDDHSATSRAFPEPLEWDVAVEYLRTLARKKNMDLFINTPGVRYARIYADGRVDTMDYRPDLKINSTGVEFASQNTGFLLSMM